MTSKAKNVESDVRAIQALLDGIKPADGGPSVPLAVDGKRGPKTENAIQQFQFKQVEASWPMAGSIPVAPRWPRRTRFRPRRWRRWMMRGWCVRSGPLEESLMAG